MNPTSTLTLADAQKILRQFNCLKPEGVEGDRSILQQAVQLVAQHSDYQILGICADDLAGGTAALESYASALGYIPAPSFQPLEGAVYIKFNPKTGLCYADSYFGEHRGVLVSCQSAYESGVNEMYGHLPLDLFA